jgi:hypothetical protein
MNIFRKAVVLSCLTYGLYGIISWIQLGAFVPAFLLRPLLLFLILIFFLIENFQKGNCNTNRLGAIWLFSFVFVGHYFMELFFNFSRVQFYMDWVHPFVFVVSVLLFCSWIVLLIRQITIKLNLRIITSLVGLSVVLLSILFFGRLAYDWGIVVLAILFFGIDRILLSAEINKINEQQLTLLYGAGALTFMEQITYLL